MTENHGSRGFMTMGAGILGLVFLGVTYGILVPVLIRWIDSGAIITVVCVLLFVPLFVASFWLADVLTGFESGKERGKKRKSNVGRPATRSGGENVSRSETSARPRPSYSVFTQSSLSGPRGASTREVRERWERC